ncbi:MAG TPA: histidine kinase [Lapillicoccus sp.]|nr:histidine kinase [Lapillicoccus sp.]
MAGPALAGRWRVTLAVAVVVVLPPTVTLLVIATQGTEIGWAALLGPLTLGIAVVLSRVNPELAAAILAAGLLTTVGATLHVGSSDSAVVMAGALAVYLGVCWVTCMLGSRVPLVRSWVWLVAVSLAALWRLGEDDVPLLLLLAGWYVVGVILRSRALVEEQLRARVEELAAEQERYALEAVRLERAVIARELHDVVAHCMTVIVIQARAGQQLLARDPDGAAEALEAISASALQAEQDIAALVELVNPQQSRPLTRTLLDDLVRRSVSTGTRVSLAVDGDLDRLGPELAVAAHRAVQEGLTNAFRHAPGGNVEIDVRCRSSFALTVISDPAVGPAPLSGSGSGRGLEGIRERMASLGGTASWGADPDGRWRVAVAAPCEQAELSPAGP